MAFNEAMGQLAIRAAKVVRGSVCELGNQTFRAKRCGQFTSTADFYKSLGFSRYLAIDVNEKMGAVAMDLNASVQRDYGFSETFDLVTNNGTGEHLFNQAAVFKNCHDLCKVCGVMLHQLPFSGWWNHGFFCIQPVLFVDLARANGYEMLFAGYAGKKGDLLDVADFGKPMKEETVDMKRLGPNINLYCAMRKKVDAPFRVPLQGKYVADVESAEIAAKYA